MLRPLAFVLPSAGLRRRRRSAGRRPGHDRHRAAADLGVIRGVRASMPLIGLGLGVTIARAAGGVAGYMAAWRFDRARNLDAALR